MPNRRKLTVWMTPDEFRQLEELRNRFSSVAANASLTSTMQELIRRGYRDEMKPKG